MADLAVVFPAVEDLERVGRALARSGAPRRVVRPPPVAEDVAVPFLVTSDAGRLALHAAIKAGVVIAGTAPYREAAADVFSDLGPAPPEGAADVAGRMAVAFVAPCIAADDHLRLTAQVEGDLGPVMPYLNAEMPAGTFSPHGPTFTFMDGARLINLFPHRAAIARAREMQDAWRTLVRLRRLVAGVWARRGSITPLFERRVQVSALELYSRLPRTNCRRCGEATCIAFAAKVLSGEQRLSRCAPVFEGGREDLRAALLDIAAGLGI